jgi:RNA ligase
MIAKLNQYVEEKWLVKQNHPVLPLEIYNYSQSTQYEYHWDETTLACRGLIVDTEADKVIIFPFPKFFNYEEIPTNVPWSTSDYVHIQDKMDGSLGIFFHYRGQWHLATRGSFTSDQAIKGLSIIKEKFFLDSFQREYAYLVEIIYPENRIVIDYGEEKITFLGVVKNFHYGFDGQEADYELPWVTAHSILKNCGIKSQDIVKTKQVFELGPELYRTLKSFNTTNEEGYVLRFFPSNFRCKIKFEDYITLHRILTNVSSYDIWENLMKFGMLPEAMLKDVPDEFYKWVKEMEDAIVENYTEVEMSHRIAAEQFSQIENQKEYALKVLEYSKSVKINTGILFAMRSGKDYTEYIWKMIKPAYSKPFYDNTPDHED